MTTPDLHSLTKAFKTLNPDSINPSLLQALHLLTKDKKLNQDAARKLKQIFHLIQQMSPMLEKIFAEQAEPLLLDLGCGKAYLGFLLNELLCQKLGRGTIIGVESREDLVATCQALTQKLNYKNLEFQKVKIEDCRAQSVHLVTALHACDTATDDAIAFALKNQVPYIALVPCCQAEVAEQLHQAPKRDLWPLWRHGIFAREFGSHLTNVIRCLVLESQGYKITVTEFTGWEHSLKNELIMAEKIQKQNALAKEQLEKLLRQIPVRPRKLEEFLPGS